MRQLQCQAPSRSLLLPLLRVEFGAEIVTRHFSGGRIAKKSNSKKGKLNRFALALPTELSVFKLPLQTKKALFQSKSVLQSTISLNPSSTLHFYPLTKSVLSFLEFRNSQYITESTNFSQHKWIDKFRICVGMLLSKIGAVAS